MARRPFGGTAADVAVDSHGNEQAGAVLTVWTAATGGTQITDLQTAAGATATTVVAGTDGLFSFLGPADGTSTVYLDGGGSVRYKALSTDLASRVTTLEAAPGGGGTAATTTFTPSGSVAATDVQSAIVEVAAEYAAADTAALVTAAADATTKANAAQAAAIAAAAADATSKVGTETTRATTAEALKAPLASPTFTGVPAAPTAAPGTSTTQLATTAFVAAQSATSSTLTGVVTPAATSTFTAQVSKHNPVNAAGGALTANLPTGASAGQFIAISKEDTVTANAVSVTGSIRGTGAQTITLSLYREAVVLVADASGSWWPFGDHKTTSSLTALFDARYDAAGAAAAAVSALVAGAPGALDTLNELAAALTADEGTAATLATTVAGTLAKASNLSDLASAATARTNLGLGTAATANTGTASGNVPVLDSAGKLAPASKRLAASSSYNFTPANTRYFRAAMSRALSGGTNAHIAFFGDSTTYGPTDATALPSLFRAISAARGVPQRGTGILPFIHLTAGTSRNPIVTAAGSLSNYVAGPMGCGGFIGNGGSLTIATTTDLFTAYYIQRTANGGTITTTVDGGASTSLVCTTGGGSNLFVTQTYPVTSGAHTLVLNGPASGNGFLWGVEARVGGATGGLRVSNLGVSGRTSTTAAATSGEGLTSPLYGIDAAKADLLVVNLGINDGLPAGDALGVQTTLATYNANLTAIVNRQRANGGAASTGGDVVFVVFNPQQSGFATLTQAQYVAEIYNVADALNVPVIDLQDRWTSYAVSAPSPFSYYADGTHPNAAGYADIANVVYQALAAVGAGL